ncbi:hypothetical protein MRX96_014001 [Rhipicephalus microplus]
MMPGHHRIFTPTSHPFRPHREQDAKWPLTLNIARRKKGRPENTKTKLKARESLEIQFASRLAPHAILAGSRIAAHAFAFTRRWWEHDRSKTLPRFEYQGTTNHSRARHLYQQRIDIPQREEPLNAV